MGMQGASNNELESRRASNVSACCVLTLPACRTSGPSPGPVTCVDFDVLLPVKMQDKIAPVFDPLLEDKQVRAAVDILHTSQQPHFAAVCDLLALSCPEPIHQRTWCCKQAAPHYHSCSVPWRRSSYCICGAVVPTAGC